MKMVKIFISYSRVDKPFLDELLPQLRHNYPNYVFWCDHELTGGDIWWNEILKNIASSHIFLYLLSNESVTSPYCQAEYKEAKRYQKRIILVQIRDRTQLTGDLPDIHYVDMKAGSHNTAAYIDLTSINTQKIYQKNIFDLYTNLPRQNLKSKRNRPLGSVDRKSIHPFLI